MTPMTSPRRMEGVRAWGRAADAFETVAWRPPSSTRFDARVANDPAVAEPMPKDRGAAPVSWAILVGGGVVAALMGALLGGALAL